jgi:hypothetical protein
MVVSDPIGINLRKARHMFLICRKIKESTMMSIEVLMNMFSKLAQALQYVLTDKANELAKKTASSGAAAK